MYSRAGSKFSSIYISILYHYYGNLLWEFLVGPCKKGPTRCWNVLLWISFLSRIVPSDVCWEVREWLTTHQGQAIVPLWDPVIDNNQPFALILTFLDTFEYNGF